MSRARRVSAPTGIRSGRSAVLLVVVAVAVVATTLRGPIVAVAPVIGVIRDDLLLTAAQSGLFTSIPVLCFAVVAPLAVLLITRLGPDAAVTASILGVAAGMVVRSSGGVGWMIAGTILIGAAITVGNVVVPVVIRRDVPPDRAALATGVYSASLNIGTAITTLGTAPLAEVVGWRVGLVSWTVFAVVALLLWVRAVGGRRAFTRSAPVPPPTTPSGGPAEAPRIWRDLSVLMLAAAFAGQAFSYYGVTSWLPTILVDENGFTLAQGGAASSVFQISAVVGAIGVPLLLARRGPLPAFLVLGALWATVPIGLIAAPALWPLWCVSGGIAQGGGFTAVFVVIVRLARSDAHASRLSAIVQAVGYAAAATAPAILGLVHDRAGGWTSPLLVVLGAVCIFAGLGAASAIRTRRGTGRPAS